MELYDVIVLGAGSAGMPAAIYAHRFGLKTLLIGKVVGGTLNDSHKVENYPGFAAIPGYDLMMKFKEHVDSLGIPVKEEQATAAAKGKDGTFTVTTEGGKYRARTLIFATGTQHRRLDIPGEGVLMGKGVSYCATCDAAFFRNVDVAIAGGGDAAAQAADLLAQFASKVYVLVRRDVMRAEPFNRQRLEQNPKVAILYSTQPKEVLGESGVTGLKVVREGKEELLAVQGFFIEIGADVRSELAAQLGVRLNEQEEIIIDVESRTNVKHVYAAGDCANRKFKQAITGAAEGVIAAFSAYEDLKKAQGEKAEISYH
jgi:thioredoxin reductase (NADPH)